MIAGANFINLLIIIGSVVWLSGCDDDERKAREKEYEVTILISDHIREDVINVKPVRKFTKPRIEVHAPEGVTVVPIETKPRKTTVIDFAPLGPYACIAALAILVFSRLKNMSRFIRPPYTSGDSAP